MPPFTTSSFLLSNLHCPTCISVIQSTLDSLNPRPTSVSPSLVTSWVTVQHSDSLHIHDIQRSLEHAGFEVLDVSSDAQQATIPAASKSHIAVGSGIGYLDRLLLASNDDSAKSKIRNQHRRICPLCRLDPEVPYNPDTDAAKPVAGANSGAENMAQSNNLPLVVVDSNDSEIQWRAFIAISGMTCAACVNNVTAGLKEKDWIREVVVNLVSHTATVDFVGEEHKDEIPEAIEDLGFEATIDSVVDLKKYQDNVSATFRTVDIHIGGMFCRSCPEKVLSCLDDFEDQITIEQTISLEEPILTITYAPQVPGFTIRDILAAIRSVDAALIPSIYHRPSLEERSRQIHKREQKRLLVRVLLTFIFAIPTFLIGILFMSLLSANNPIRKFFDSPIRAGVSRSQWGLLALASPIYFFCADVFHLRALKEVRSLWRRGSQTPILQRFYRFGSMNMLMSLGTSIAYFASIGQLIASGLHPPIKPDNSAYYFDSVVFLTLFLLVGRLIESYSKSKTGDAVTMLGSLRPTEAHLLISNNSNQNTGSTESSDLSESPESLTDTSNPVFRLVNVDELELGDTVKVLHGESPPCDGVIVKGETTFDESSLTGEAKPVMKIVGSDVYSGTINKGGPVSMEITGAAGSSMLDQIVKAVREGQTRRAPMERIADTLTSYFVPVVTLIAIVTWVVWLALGVSGHLPKDYLGDSSRGWTTWSLQFAIAVFVVACPCGLALAAPTAIFVGGGLAAQHGILAKGGGEAFEKASRLDCIVFDKTGTLTKGGDPIVTDHKLFTVRSKVKDHEDRTTMEAVTLSAVLAIEENSGHAIAKALVKFCKPLSRRVPTVVETEETAGKGMKGTLNYVPNITAQMIVGNESLMVDHNVPLSAALRATLDKWKGEGKSVALAAMNVRDNIQQPHVVTWQLAAVFAISDPIRAEAPSIIKALKERGTAVWMLSGDNKITANAIGAQVGIPPENIIAGVLPSEKAEKIKYLQKSLKARPSKGHEHYDQRAMVAMVGDGINDSPALTAADVGIAIGSGSDIAISAAEFVLVKSNLETLLVLLDLSKTVFRRIQFNFGWALIYNLIALPVAAGALYPIVSGGAHIKLDPVWASLAMAASSISVVCSSLALKTKLPVVGFKVKSLEKTAE